MDRRGFLARNFAPVFFLGTTLAIGACGRQITPDPPTLGAGGAPSGFMSITFDVAGQLDFSDYQYWVVFNTTGTNGQTPTTIPWNNNWAGYSFAIEVGGAAGVGTDANVYQFVRSSKASGAQPSPLPVQTTPTLLQYNPDSNGAGTQFTVVFSRSLFRGILATPAPIGQIWLFNAFTTQANAQNEMQFVDSLGRGGITDPQWPSPQLDVSEAFDTTFTALNSGNQIAPSAQITQITLGNNP
jgi:hypothetical protein